MSPVSDPYPHDAGPGSSGHADRRRHGGPVEQRGSTGGQDVDSERNYPHQLSVTPRRGSREEGCHCDNVNTLCFSAGERWPLLIDPQLQGIKWIKSRCGSSLKVVSLGQRG